MRVLKVYNPDGFPEETPIFTTLEKAQNFVVELKRIGFFDDETDTPKVLKLDDGFAVAVVDKIDGGTNYIPAAVVVTSSMAN